MKKGFYTSLKHLMLALVACCCFGVSAASAATIVVTTDVSGATGNQVCNQTAVTMTATLGVNETIQNWEFSDNGGVSWGIFAGVTTNESDINFPIANGRRYRVRVFNTVTFTTSTSPFTNNVTNVFVQADLGPLTFTAPPATLTYVCQGAAPLQFTATAANSTAIGYAIANGGASTIQPAGGLLTLAANYFNTTGSAPSVTPLIITAAATGCVAGVPTPPFGAATIPTVARNLDVRRTLGNGVNATTFAAAPTPVCEGSTATYVAQNNRAFNDPMTGSSFKYTLSTPSSGSTIGSATGIANWSANFNAANNPVTVLAQPYGCNAGGIEGYALTGGTVNIAVQQNPILKSIGVEGANPSCSTPVTINFFFDELNGSTGQRNVTLSIDGVPQVITLGAVPVSGGGTINAKHQFTFNQAVGTTSVYTVTAVSNNNALGCGQLDPLPTPLTVVVAPPTVLNSLTASTNNACVGDPAIVLTASATGSNLLYTFKRNGTTVQGPSATSTFSINTNTAANQGNNVNWSVTVSGTCGAPQMASQFITIVKKPMLTTISNIAGNVCEGGSAVLNFVFNTATGSAGAKRVDFSDNLGNLYQATFFGNGGTWTSGALNASTQFAVLSVTNVDGGVDGCVQMPAPTGLNIVVTVLKNPIVTLAGVPNPACQGTAVVLTAGINMGTGPLLYTFAKGGTVIQGPSALNSITIQGLPANSGAYTVTAQSISCGTTSQATTTLVIDPTTVAGTVTPATTTMVCGPTPTNLVLTGNVGAVLSWQSSTDDVTFTNIPGTAGLTTFTVTAPPGVTYYRAVVKSGACLTLFTNAIKMTADQPVVGGTVVLQGSAATVRSTAICATDNVTLLATGFVGRIIRWEENKQNQPDFIEILGTAGFTSLTVNGSVSNVARNFRCVVCSPLGICTGAQFTANSASFRVNKKANCFSADRGNVAESTSPFASRLSPNPASDKVLLSVENAAEGDAEVRMFDLSGRQVLMTKHYFAQGNNEISVDLTAMADGMYLVRVTDKAANQSTIKLVKKN